MTGRCFFCAINNLPNWFETAKLICQSLLSVYLTRLKLARYAIGEKNYDQTN
jgi:hypothetical protein